MRKLGISVLCVVAGLMGACRGGGKNDLNSEIAYGTAKVSTVRQAQPVAKTERAVIENFTQHFSPQLKDQWCWAACIQMVLDQQFGRHVTQEQVVRQATGKNVNEPATADVIVRAFSTTVGHGGKPGKVVAQYVDGLPPENDLWADLRAGLPRVMAVAAPGSNGREHVVICYGAERNASREITRLHIFDPAPGRGATVVAYDAVRSAGTSGGRTMGARLAGGKPTTPPPQVTGSFRISVVRK